MRAEKVEPMPEPQRVLEEPERPVQPTPGVMAKNPGMAVVLSFFIPGVGHMYVGAVAWGLVILVLHILNWTVILLSIGLPPAAFIGLFIWIGGMKYSYKAARRFQPAQRTCGEVMDAKKSIPFIVIGGVLFQFVTWLTAMATLLPDFAEPAPVNSQ